MNLVFLFLIFQFLNADNGIPRILNIGHRGDPQHQPDNTMGSFESAWKMGADGIETDLRFTSDGIIVLHHDDTLGNTNCSGTVSSKTFQELSTCFVDSKYPIPTFEEAIDFAKEKDMIVIMDLKVHELGQDISRIVKPKEMEGRVVASCWYDEDVQNIKEYLNITVKQYLGHFPTRINETYFSDWIEKGVSAFSLGEHLLTEIPAEFIKLAHENQMQVFAWTIDTTLEIYQLARHGIDGIITNKPFDVHAAIEEIQKILFESGPPSSFSSSSSSSSINEASFRTYPLFVGHRGDPIHAPENTLSAFRWACKDGMDGFETDLRWTKDGYIVLMHDDTLDRTTNCTGLISDYTLQYLKENCDAGSWFSSEYAGERIPTFEEAVSLAKDLGLFIIMDMKADGLAKSIFEITKKYDFESRVTASCRTFDQVKDVRAYLKRTPIQFLGEATKDYIETYWENFMQYNIHSFNYHNDEELTPEFVKEAHLHMFEVLSWLSNDEKTIFNSYKNGHDAIMSNDPQMLKKVVDEIRERAFPNPN